jgi:hypothetical protein
VVTIADFDAGRHGVRFSRSAAGESPGWAGLPLAADLADHGRLTVPLHAVFPLKEAATAHDVSATGHARGKIVITVPDTADDSARNQRPAIRTVVVWTEAAHRG